MQPGFMLIEPVPTREMVDDVVPYLCLEVPSKQAEFLRGCRDELASDEDPQQVMMIVREIAKRPSRSEDLLGNHRNESSDCIEKVSGRRALNRTFAEQVVRIDTEEV